MSAPKFFSAQLTERNAPPGKRRKRNSKAACSEVTVPFASFALEFVSTQCEVVRYAEIGAGTYSRVYRVELNPATPWFGFQELAVKRITRVSDCHRICNEAIHLKTLQGKYNVIGLISILSQDDQVSLVMPYFPHRQFTQKFLSELDSDSIRKYMLALLTALQHTHAHHIIHRDVKPVNFLCGCETTGNSGRYCLVDFGLAQKETPSLPSFTRTPSTFSYGSSSRGGSSGGSSSSSNTSLSKVDGTTANKGVEQQLFSREVSKFSGNQRLVVGFLPWDKRHVAVAERAGTRGFRAPEVLLRMKHQTTAIDIWSAGIILLTLLTGKYPFSLPQNDSIALAHICALCGTAAVNALAKRTFHHLEVKDSNQRPSLDWKTFVDQVRAETGLPPLEVEASVYDLLRQMLAVDPQFRITATLALKHGFF